MAPFFWSWHWQKLDLEKNKKLIISQILNFGNFKAINWLINHYPLKEIKKVVAQPQRGSWEKKRLNYWQTILGLKIDPIKFRLAIREIDPCRWQKSTAKFWIRRVKSSSTS